MIPTGLDPKAVGELRELLGRVQYVAGRDDAVRLVAEALTILDRLTAPRTWAAEEKVHEWTVAGYHRTAFYDNSGILRIQVDCDRTIAFDDVSEVNAVAAILGIPGRLTLPKPQRATWGPESAVLDHDEYEKVAEGMRFLSPPKEGFEGFTFRVEHTATIREKKYVAVVMEMGSDSPQLWDESGFCGFFPADLATARQLDRETGEGQETTTEQPKRDAFDRSAAPLLAASVVALLDLWTRANPNRTVEKDAQVIQARHALKSYTGAEL